MKAKLEWIRRWDQSGSPNLNHCFDHTRWLPPGEGRCRR